MLTNFPGKHNLFYKRSFKFELLKNWVYKESSNFELLKNLLRTTIYKFQVFQCSGELMDDLSLSSQG